ncbi:MULTISPECIES: hypothetical protein [unclassified Sphingobacterium]|uniref:hypothetical protein n=1 Tax=unclassified Sphingobacterium TaxID=2609468 RepID=UPI0025E607A7|nr:MULTISPECIES: hypothetical protein [unclassified Sphingobacterium]
MQLPIYVTAKIEVTKAPIISALKLEHTIPLSPLKRPKGKTAQLGQGRQRGMRA